MNHYRVILRDKTPGTYTRVMYAIRAKDAVEANRMAGVTAVRRDMAFDRVERVFKGEYNDIRRKVGATPNWYAVI